MKVVTNIKAVDSRTATVAVAVIIIIIIYLS
jgi:hypothetical protein